MTQSNIPRRPTEMKACAILVVGRCKIFGSDFLFKIFFSRKSEFEWVALQNLVKLVGYSKRLRKLNTNINFLRPKSDAASKNSISQKLFCPLYSFLLLLRSSIRACVCEITWRHTVVVRGLHCKRLFHSIWFLVSRPALWTVSSARRTLFKKPFQ